MENDKQPVNEQRKKRRKNVHCLLLGKSFLTSYLTYSTNKLPKVSGGKGFCCSKNWSFWNPRDGSASMFIRAWLCSVTASSSSSERGGMSVRASHAASTEKHHDTRRLRFPLDSFFLSNPRTLDPCSSHWTRSSHPIL